MGVTALTQLPNDGLPEVAFAGRSNVGKSSLLNALVTQHRLARVSNTPGRTREINLFDLEKRLRLVDLPGYGFAAVERAVRKEWNSLIPAYLTARRELARVIVLIDGRHGFKAGDEMILDFMARQGIPAQIVLTKADKKEANEDVRNAVLSHMLGWPNLLPQLIATSAEKKLGIDSLRESLLPLARPARPASRPSPRPASR